MNCIEWEERIVWYAGGDLAPAEAQAAERHLGECSGCQVLLSGFRASLALMQEAHGEPIEAAHFAAVRARVFSEIAAGERPRWRFGWLYAMAAAAVVMLVAIWPRPELHMVVPMPSAPTAPGIAKVTLPRPRQVVAAAGKPIKLPAPAQPMVVKLLTNDPDVVIYWITGTKGE